jgi:D-alanyl-D-alanine carboxypeptidase
MCRDPAGRTVARMTIAIDTRAAERTVMSTGAKASRVLTVLALVATIMAVSAAQTASAAPPSGKRITRTVRALMERYPLRSTLFGVWVDGRRVASGALGEAQPGVPATRADHFRIGNVTESITTTLLLRLVDQGRVRLEDPLSRWFPNLPNAGQVTVGMLPRSVSGYSDYVTTPRFERAFNANPFRTWRPSELIRIAFSRPPLFAPGTSWAFSDTNFLLLGEVLRRVGGMPVERLLRRQILTKLGLRQTEMRLDSDIPAPVLHGYSRDRGRYEDSTSWSPSWVPRLGNMISTLGDMGRWARALGTGSLLSPQSHALQVGPQNVGLGPLTASMYYAMGFGVSNGWIAANPQVPGYNGIVSYLPAKRTAVVVFVTQGPKGKPSVAYASAIYNRLGKLLAPEQPPNAPVCPRPPC